MVGTGYMALGADLLDKNQNISSKGVRNAASLPIVAIDLYGDDCGVAYFPPTVKQTGSDTNNSSDQDSGEEKKDEPSIKSGMLARSVIMSGGDLVLLRDDVNSYKAIRRYLNKGEGHATVLNDAIV